MSVQFNTLIGKLAGARPADMARVMIHEFPVYLISQGLDANQVNNAFSEISAGEDDVINAVISPIPPTGFNLYPSVNKLVTGSYLVDLPKGKVGVAYSIDFLASGQRPFQSISLIYDNPPSSWNEWDWIDLAISSQVAGITFFATPTTATTHTFHYTTIDADGRLIDVICRHIIDP